MTIKRTVTEESERFWGTEEILLFIGPRQAGKTTILRQIEQTLTGRGTSCYWISLEKPSAREVLNEDPDNLFKLVPARDTERVIVFIDEIQYLDDPTQFLKYHYDEHRARVKLIVSGSSAFYIDQKFRDSLVGRKKIFYVYTLSFREFLRFTGREDLATKTDFTKLLIPEQERVSIAFHEFLRYGGYPRVVLADERDKKDILHEIAYSYVKKDIFEANIQEEDNFYKMLTILSHQAGSLVNVSELANTLGMERLTVQRYLDVMHRSFHVAFPRPFWGNVRKELTKMPKVYWFDLGLRNFFAGNHDSYAPRLDKEPLLENAVFRQLLEQGDVYDWGQIHFWRTASGQEVDFVLDDKKQAYEVKADPAKASLRHLRAFQKAYPNIDISLITIDRKQDTVSGIPVRNVWELEQQ